MKDRLIRSSCSNFNCNKALGKYLIVVIPPKLQLLKVVLGSYLTHFKDTVAFKYALTNILFTTLHILTTALDSYGSIIDISIVLYDGKIRLLDCNAV